MHIGSNTAAAGPGSAAPISSPAASGTWLHHRPLQDRHPAAPRRPHDRLRRARRAARRQPPSPFSFMTERIPLRQMPCHITYTNQTTHEIIRANLDRAPMYGGHIQGVGPRYCPSIEDKVRALRREDRHQIFLEPEGLTHQRDLRERHLAPRLPDDVQRAFIKPSPAWSRPHDRASATPSSTTSAARRKSTRRWK